MSEEPRSGELPIGVQDSGDDRSRLAEDAQALADEARWLHNYHVQRGESAQQRAVAVLGFGGVLIGLVPTAIPTTRAGGTTEVLIAGLALVAVAVGLAAKVLMPGDVRTLAASMVDHEISELMTLAKGNRAGLQSLQTARNLTHPPAAPASNREARDVSEFEKPESLIDSESAISNSRLAWLTASVIVMVIGLVTLTAAIAISSLFGA